MPVPLVVTAVVSVVHALEAPAGALLWPRRRTILDPVDHIESHPPSPFLRTAATVYQLRVAGPRDVPELFRVRTSVHENHLSLRELAQRGVTPESVARQLRSGEARAWLAAVEGRVVAFSMAIAQEATVFAMFVEPGFEGRGMGRALMREAEDWLFAYGWDEIWLLTDSDRRVRANGFYRHLGWVERGLQDDGQVKFTRTRASCREAGPAGGDSSRAGPATPTSSTGEDR